MSQEQSPGNGRVEDTTSAVQRLAVDDKAVRLPGDLELDATYDVLLNSQHVWSIQPSRDAEGGVWLSLEWPKALQAYLRGRAEVTLREHVSGKVVATTRHVFADEPDREVHVVDSAGNELVVDKWGRLIRPLAGDDGALVGALLDKVEELMATIHEETGLPAFICYGTLLGAVRDGTFIGHDNDVDIAYASDAHYPVDVTRESFRVQARLKERGWKVRRGSGARLNVRIPLPDGSNRFVDVFSAHWIEDVLYIPSDTGFPLPRETVLPLTTVELYGRPVPAPAQYETLLRATYGESWRVPDPSFRYETPRWLARRLGGWHGGLISGRKHWDAFGGKSQHLVPDEPTAFARWVAEQYPSDRPLLDVGAGTGRDSVWFAEEHGREVIALEYSASALHRTLRQHTTHSHRPNVSVQVVNLYDVRAVLALGAQLSRREGPIDVYARFLLHTLQPLGQENVIRLASMCLRRGGRLFLEFRTPRDRRTKHLFAGPRFYLAPKVVRRRIHRMGGTVIHQEAGRGLAVLREEDPVVCRMVATWTGQPT